MLWQPILILGAQLLYVPLVVLRTLMMVKGEKERSALFATVEGGVHVISLSIVFSDLSNYFNMVAYSLGFGLGMYLGSIVEEKLAIGYVSLQVNTSFHHKPLIERLRDADFSVALTTVEGIESIRVRLDCTARRDREHEFMAIVNECDPNAFVVSFETRNFQGGYIKKKSSKRTWFRRESRPLTEE
ncbi:DUF2179 domain-containing protein [Shouchella lehensis]|mgnify:CR=1 FL=1|uniref:Uncharacterized protein n=2 Tax=Shouchella lehensis TaxID=300825 RepID=A0A060LS02_9BACI|nr:DUF2179 domain-containing protein [Shouchella lehensis]AIC92932.1 hypothetical protein BleG1_0324 [Shouchella lehensis G1]MBG9783267.1 hypothetical protein [Shouchella lehensis]RQW22535.1 DUF2179 domain-containing protein [Bacillus sp. C1-1]TES49359.1 DUF2179 domain-containing protein [Shouchella lehensis]